MLLLGRGLGLHVLRQVGCLREHEDQGEAHQPEQFELHPDVLGELVGHDQVERAHGREKPDPRPVEPSPDRVRQGHGVAHHPLQQAALTDVGCHEERNREQPVDDRRLPLDEDRVVQQEGQAAEHDEQAEGDGLHLLDPAVAQPLPADLERRRCHRHRRGDIDVPRLVSAEKQ